MARGDHLYVERMGGVYSHHGIDCGDGTVIHYWPDGPPLASSVQQTTVEEFAEGGAVMVRRYAFCDLPDTVVARAVGSLGARGFDPLTSNCEHFAVWCKTGSVESSQIRSVESYLWRRPGAALMTWLLAPVVAPVLVFTVCVGNVLGGLTGETQERRKP